MKKWIPLRQWRARLKQWAISQLLAETGVDLSPEPNVWGILNPAEEENVLARLYDDKEWIALMRKYAEGANKALIAKVNIDRDYWKFRAQFFCYNHQLLKARRAAIKLNKKNVTTEDHHKI